MEVCETALCYHVHICLSNRSLQIKIINRIRDNWPIKLAVVGDNTGTSWLVISANITHQLSCVLTNNLNLKGLVLIDICVYDNTVLFHALPISVFNKIDIFSLTLWKKRYSKCVIFLWPDSLYTIYIKTFSVQEDNSNHI